MELKEAQEIVKHLGKDLNWITIPADARTLGRAEGMVDAWDKAIRAAAEIANNWRTFYKSMQDKSAPGEKDGMYRMFAAEDIEKEILSLLTKDKGNV